MIAAIWILSIVVVALLIWMVVEARAEVRASRPFDWERD